MLDKICHFLTLRKLALLKILFLLITLVVVIMGIFLAISGVNIQSDLRALFPKNHQSSAMEAVDQRIYASLGNKIIIAVAAQDESVVRHAADILANAIKSNGDFKQDDIDKAAQQLEQQKQLLARHRFQLLTSTQYNMLAEGNTEEILNRAGTAFFGFNPQGLPLLEDPLNLFSQYLDLLQPLTKGELRGDRLWLTDENGFLVLFALTLNEDSFNLDLQARAGQWLAKLKNQLAQNSNTESARVLVSGAVFHAAQASAQAQREMTVIGFGSTLGIIILFILAFRRIKPLLLGICSLAYGCGCAFVITHSLFAEIHLMTLVFGASLLGVAIDYSLHFFCKQQFCKQQEASGSSGDAVINKLLPSLSLGLITSVLGYSCLFQAALPSLWQIACFSIVGLVATWLLVVALYPLILREELPQGFKIIDQSAQIFWHFWSTASAQRMKIYLLIIFIIVVLGAVRWSISSDARTFYSPSPDLMSSERRLQQALDTISPNQYFLLRGDSVETVLRLEERVRKTHLDPLIQQGILKHYAATSQWVPSIQQQSDNYALLQNTIYRPDGLADNFLIQLGVDANTRTAFLNTVNTQEKNYLQVQDWLSVARPDQSILWLGQSNEEVVSVIALSGIKDLKVLKQIDEPSVILVDRVASLSSLLQKLTESAKNLLILAYLFVLFFLWFFYPKLDAFWLVCIPLSATLISLAVLGLLSVPINLFHIFACYLILGLGIDYSIFSYEGGLRDKVFQRSIFLSALTSLLSFGFLTLSSTPMVQSFGVVLGLGCFFNLLLTPLVGGLNTANNSSGKNNHG
jgi:predicted exporter